MSKRDVPLEGIYNSNESTTRTSHERCFYNLSTKARASDFVTG